MPLMGLKYRPIKNSLLLFSNTSHEDMIHWVAPVTSGCRFVSQGFFFVDG